jgi:hypothetical protein
MKKLFPAFIFLIVALNMEEKKMRGKNLIVAMLSVFLSTPVFAGQDAAETAAEAAGAYMGATHILQAVKKTPCGYALLLDSDEVSRKAEQDVLKNLPSKYQKDLSSAIKYSKQDSIDLVAKDLKDDRLRGKLDEKTICGLMVGRYVAIFGQYWASWERAKKNL